VIVELEVSLAFQRAANLVDRIADDFVDVTANAANRMMVMPLLAVYEARLTLGFRPPGDRTETLKHLEGPVDSRYCKPRLIHRNVAVNLTGAEKATLTTQ